VHRITERKVLLAGLVAFVALASIGCGRRTVVITGARYEQYEANLLRFAARDTGCHPSQLVPQQIASDPPVLTVTGCAQPVEYWLRCVRGGRNCRWLQIPPVTHQASPLLACPPEMVAPQPGPAPHVRFASGCGRGVQLAMTCNTAACGWAPVGPVQVMGVAAAPPPVQAPPMQSSATVVVQAPPVSAASPMGGSVQAQLEAQREALLSCVDAGSVVLRMRWTADGQVIAQLPPELVGTAADGCIQAVLGSVRVQAQAAGEIVLPLQ
jgi:hypothetical protein